MKLKQKIKFISLILFLGLTFSLLSQSLSVYDSTNSSMTSYIDNIKLVDTALAQTKKIDGPGLRTVGNTAYNGLSSEKDLDQFIVGLTNFALNFVTSIAILMLLYGGYLWIIDLGDDQSVEKAKKIIAGSVIGILLVITAYTIVNTVVGFGTGDDTCDLAMRSGDQTQISIHCSDEVEMSISTGAGLGSFIGSLLGL